jgi:hypothetical protein
MRCVKCGKIVNETLAHCQCGRDMQDMKMLLGNFPEANKTFNWFSQIFDNTSKNEYHPDSAMGGIGDISDLFKDNHQEDSFLQSVDTEFTEFESLAQKSSPVSLGELGGDVNEKDLEDALKNLKF